MFGKFRNSRREPCDWCFQLLEQKETAPTDIMSLSVRPSDVLHTARGRLKAAAVTSPSYANSDTLLGSCYCRRLAEGHPRPGAPAEAIYRHLCAIYKHKHSYQRISRQTEYSHSDHQQNILPVKHCSSESQVMKNR